MTDAAAPAAFGVETIELDLPPLVGRVQPAPARRRPARRRPARSADFARALDARRARSRAGGCTGPRARCSCPTRRRSTTFDAVFFSVFGDGRAAEPTFDARRGADRRRRRATSGRVDAQAMPGDSGDARRDGGRGRRRRPPRDDDERRRRGRGAARAGERRGACCRRKSFDALEPHELAQLYRLMSRLELATPLRRTRRHEQRPPRRSASTCAARCARSLRTGGDPIRLARRRRRVAPPPARDAVRHLGLDGALRARLPAVPDLRRRQRPERRGVRVRDAADAADPRARVAQPRARDPARRRRGARLVERDADRRRAEGVQRPPRPPRHGARRGGRDPLRRLGARRPGARRPRDGAPRDGSRTGSCGSIRASSASAFSVQAGGMVAALPHCDALVSGHSFEALGEVVEAIGPTSQPSERRPRRSRRRPPEEPEPWASATPVAGQLGRDAERLRPEQGQHDPGLGDR